MSKARSSRWLLSGTRTKAFGCSSLLALALLVGAGCSSAETAPRGEAPLAEAPREESATPTPAPAAPGGLSKGVVAEAPKGDAAKKAPRADARESLSPPGGMLFLPEDTLDRAGARDGGSTRDQAGRELSKSYYNAGKRLFDDMDYSRAYESLRLAVERDPMNKDAVELYYVCGSILGKREDELKASHERLVQEHQVKIELTRQEMLRYYEAGEKKFGEGEFEDAIRELERAREMIAWYPYQIDQAGYREKSEKLIAEAKRKRNLAALEERDLQERAAIQKAREQETRKQQEDSRRIDQLLAQAADLVQAHRFVEAKAVAQRVLDADPRNPFAKKLFEYALLGEHTMIDKRIHDEKDEESWRDQLNQKAVSITHEAEVFRLPADWQERTAERRPGIAVEVAEEAPWIREYKKILRERKVTLNFPDVPLQDVVLFLQDITGLNFVIGPGVDATERRISLKLKDIVLENALRLVLEQAKLTYIFDRQAIVIVEPGGAGGEIYFEIYDVSDILYKIQDFPGARITLPDPNAAAAGGAGGGGSLIFDDAAGSTESTINPDVLIEIIKGSSGGDEAWADGTSIEGHRGQLLVNNRREAHVKIAEVLENLRRNQGLFVHIETRFIDITNDFLEDVGVDFRGLGGNPGDTTNLPNNSNPLGNPADAFSDIAGGQDAVQRFGGTDTGFNRSTPNGSRLNAQGQPVFVPGPQTEPGPDNFVARSMHIFGSSLGGNVLAGSRLVGGGGLVLQGTSLDRWQYNAIVRAENEISKVRRLTAPRVTAANREKVYTSVLTQRAYVSDWELVSGGTGLVVVEVADPIISTFQEGVVLEVRPTISSDRKYVTLDCRPSLATLVGGNIRTVTVNLGSLAMSAIQVPIGLPEITLEEAFTSVTIPDGGTALLGGFRQIQESLQESTLPIVDSIPLVNLLFKRRGELRETRSLVVLIQAHIVGIRDEEAKKFNKNP